MIRKSPAILAFLDSMTSAKAAAQPGVPRNFRKGHLLISQGEPSIQVCIIRTGIVKCSFSDENGKEFILEFLGEGEIVGELEAITKNTAVSNIQALTDISVYRMDNANFVELLQKDEEFNKTILELMAIRLTHTAQRAARQQLHPLRYNISQLMEELRYQKLPFTKQDVADYLGISLRSLNRILKDIPDR